MGMSEREVYFDNAASTPISQTVLDYMYVLYKSQYGNPSSLHDIGVLAEKQIKEATKVMASILGCMPKELVYTSGGTESNNLAILGGARANRGKKVITVKTEHPSVTETFSALLGEGYETVYISTDIDGMMDLKELEEMIDKQTVLVSVAAVNSEMGVMQNLEEIGALIKKKNERTLFHVDGVQAFGKYDIHLEKCKIDLFSISGHKIHGPKGIGALYINDRIRIEPILFGGGQQGNMRSGTENVVGICALALAAEELYRDRKTNEEKVAGLKKQMLARLAQMGEVQVNGSHTSAFILNVSFLGIPSEVLLHALEMDGVYVSAGSACSSRRAETKVLFAMGLPLGNVESSIRFSFSKNNTSEEVEYAANMIERAITFLKRYEGVRNGRK